MSDFTIEQLEALKEGTTPGPWGTMTTGVAGGDHWYVCDLSESLALIATNDGEDEEARGPNARLMAAAPALVDALIAEKQAHQKLRAGVQEMLHDLANDSASIGANMEEQIIFEERARVARDLAQLLEETSE